MSTPTLSLPIDALSTARSSFSKSRPSGIQRVSSPGPPVRTQRADQEAIEMNTLGSQKSGSLTSVAAPEVSAWTMSVKDEWIAISACFMCLFMAGWNDATTGPLLPTIQAHYHLSFTIVSMLFVSNFFGFMSAALANVFLTDRFGFGKVILLGGLAQVVAYSLLAPALPFPVMCIAYGLNGFGLGLQDAQANGFVVALPNNAEAKMGMLHAAYGAGAFVAPLVATQFAQLPRWSLYYLASLGISIINVVVLLLVFKLRSQDEIFGIPSAPADTAAQTAITINNQNKYKQIFSSRAVQLMAFFTWVYVGCEVTIGGWIVTFVIEERGGGPSAGYVSSGFFGGLMLGRVVLLWVNKKVGERRVIYLYSVLAIGLELVIWFVPNIIGDGIAVSLIGLLLGPFYPIAMNVTGRIIPKRIITGSIGWIASFGQAGSAVFPFMTGVLAQKHGVKVLQPMIVGMVGAMLVLWSIIPGSPKRRGD